MTGEGRDAVGQEVAVDHALFYKARGVNLADRGMLANFRIHQRLREAWLVALVVAKAAIAPHVDDDVAAEGLAIVDRQLAREGHRFGIVAVHMDDRRLHALGHVRGVRGPA